MTSPETPSPSPPPPEPLPERVRSSLDHTLVLVGLLFLMATIGLVLTNVRSPWAFRYWAAMFPLFGVAALWEEISRRPAGTSLLRVSLRGTAHWLGPLAALWIVFRFMRLGQVDGQTAGLLALLLLALACFFAGIHGATTWLVVAGFLTLGILVAVEVQAYLWLLVALGALVVIGLVVWRVRKRS
jgi:hypothetical protein